MVKKKFKYKLHSVFHSVQSLSCVKLFATQWTTARQASLSITSSQSLPKLLSIGSVMPSNHLIPFSSCLQSFPASGFFRMSQLFASGGQSYLAIKRNETGSFVEIWMCIESGIETEANQKEKNKSCALMYTCGI